MLRMAARDRQEDEREYGQDAAKHSFRPYCSECTRFAPCGRPGPLRKSVIRVRPKPAFFAVAGRAVRLRSRPIRPELDGHVLSFDLGERRARRKYAAFGATADLDKSKVQRAARPGRRSRCLSVHLR